jgi:hypothetical protein
MTIARAKGLTLYDHGATCMLLISAANTADWARGAFDTGRWPGSELAGRRLKVQFDANGLLSYWVNGKEATAKAYLHIPGDELSACVAYFAKKLLGKGHACYFVMVGQFDG